MSPFCEKGDRDLHIDQGQHVKVEFLASSECCSFLYVRPRERFVDTWAKSHCFPFHCWSIKVGTRAERVGGTHCKTLLKWSHNLINVLLIEQIAVCSSYKKSHLALSLNCLIIIQLSLQELGQWPQVWWIAQLIKEEPVTPSPTGSATEIERWQSPDDDEYEPAFWWWGGEGCQRRLCPCVELRSVTVWHTIRFGPPVQWKRSHPSAGGSDPISMVFIKPWN